MTSTTTQQARAATTTRRVFGLYARISDDRAEGAGVERQLEDMRRLASARDAEVVEYVDNSRSAYKADGHRPAFKRMIEDARAGRITGILAWRADRLNRRVREFEDVVDLAEAGLHVETADGALNLTTANGQFAARMLIAVAQQESALKSERIKRQQKQYREQGKWTMSIVPYGFRKDEEHRLHVDEREAALMVEVCRRLVRGDTMSAVARWLNDQGETTRAGKPFRQVTIGQLVWRERTAELVDPVDLAAARSVLASHKSKPHGAARKTLLGGVAICGACGATMKGGQANGGLSYRCSATNAGGHPHIKRDDLDSYVVRVLAERLSRPDAQAARAVTDTVDHEAALLVLDEREAQLVTLIGEGRLTAESARPGLDKIAAERAEIESQRAAEGVTAQSTRDADAVRAVVAGSDDAETVAGQLVQLSTDDLRAAVQALLIVTVKGGHRSLGLHQRVNVAAK